MWDQCTGAHEIPSAHEIDDIRRRNFFYRMEWRWPGAEDFFYRSVVCLCGHRAHLYRVHFLACAVLLV
jgi:hypothetical protein